MDRSSDYRRRAAEADRKAEDAETPTDAEAQERIAAAWRQLADDADDGQREARL